MLIQCPECGHQVSDKAPTCPNCGIEIAGRTEYNDSTTQTQQQDYAKPVVEAIPIDDEEPVVIATPTPFTQQGSPQQAKQPKRRSHTTLWISFFIAAVLCAAMLYIYKDASDQLAADKVVNMDKLKNMKEDVDSSLVDPSFKNREVREESREETEDAGSAQETESANNSESAEVSENTSSSSSRPSTAEMEKATTAVRRFFRAINSHDKDALNNSVSSFLSTFNGKERATKLDVQQYMTDLYQADVKNINWYIGDIKSISKREVGENRYEYDITLEAKKVTEREGGTSTHNYTVKAMVEDDGKVGSMNISKK